MSFIHIKKIQKYDADGTGHEFYAVPSVAIATPNGKKLIPNPAGGEASLFATLEEAEEAIRRAGFDYVFEGRKTYTLNHSGTGGGANAPANPADPLAQAVPLLIRHLQDRETTVVANSAFALGALKAAEAAEALAQMLGHEDAAVRKHVAEAMARLGAPALPALREAYLAARPANNRNTKGKNAANAPYIRLTVMSAYLEMVLVGVSAAMREQFLQLAVEALEDESWLVRAQAALVVGHAAAALEEERTRDNPPRR